MENSRLGLSRLYTLTKLLSQSMVVTLRGSRFLRSQNTARPRFTCAPPPPARAQEVLPPIRLGTSPISQSHTRQPVCNQVPCRQPGAQSVGTGELSDSPGDFIGDFIPRTLTTRRVTCPATVVQAADMGCVDPRVSFNDEQCT